MSYEQKVVWLGTVMGDTSTEEFEKWFLETAGFHVKFDKEFKLVGKLEGIHCIVFGICSKDIPKFAMFRIMSSDMKWLEDFCANYPTSVPVEMSRRYGIKIDECDPFMRDDWEQACGR